MYKRQVDAILRIMAAETRLSRCELSKLYMDVIYSFDISKSYKGRAVQSLCNKEIMYVFLQVSKLRKHMMSIVYGVVNLQKCIVAQLTLIMMLLNRLL